MDGVFPFPTKARSTLLLARLNRGRSRSRRSAALGVLGNTDNFGMRGADEGREFWIDSKTDLPSILSMLPSARRKVVLVAVPRD